MAIRQNLMAGLGCAALVYFSGCNKIERTDAGPAVSATPLPAGGAPLTVRDAAPASHSSTAAPSSQATTPFTGKRFAPNGTYFMTRRVSKMTSDGVLALPPGTRVRLVGAAGKKMTVETADGKFEVTDDQVTNDLDLAAAAARSDVRAQSVIAATEAMPAREARSSIPAIPARTHPASTPSVTSAASASSKLNNSSLDVPAHSQVSRKGHWRHRTSGSWEWIPGD